MTVQTPAGSSENSENSSGNEESNSQNSVSYETHRKLLDEKKKAQARLKELEDAEKRRQEEALLNEGKLKEALELREKELKETREQLNLFNERERQAKKLRAVIKGLGAGDLDDKWYTVIGQEIDGVAIDDDGNVDAGSVQKVVDGLKKNWPEMLRKPSAALPNGTPSGGPAFISRAEWKKLSSKEMLKWRPDQIK